MLRTYSDAIALITGGASGIGAALGRALARRGARVLLADRQGAAAEETAAAICAARGSGSAEAIELDVRDAARVERAVASAFERHGRLDYLFNNAGTGVAGVAGDCTLDDWRYVVDVNLMGVIHGVHAAYPRMVAQGFGHIVSTASTAGFMPTPFIASYGTTKHAVVGLTRALRAEGRCHGVRVSVICPGVIRTPILSAGGVFGRVRTRVPDDLQRRAWERLRPMDADRFAERVLGDVARNRATIIHPRWWRLVWWLNRLTPGVADYVAYRMLLSMRRQLEDAEKTAAGAGVAAADEARPGADAAP